MCYEYLSRYILLLLNLWDKHQKAMWSTLQQIQQTRPIKVFIRCKYSSSVHGTAYRSWYHSNKQVTQILKTFICICNTSKHTHHATDSNCRVTPNRRSIHFSEMSKQKPVCKPLPVVFIFFLYDIYRIYPNPWPCSTSNGWSRSFVQPLYSDPVTPTSSPNRKKKIKTIPRY